MQIEKMKTLFASAGKLYKLIGDERCGILAGLDLEGRLYTVFNGVVLNRVNPDAILGNSGPDGYLNPGGDGLWPAPEGTSQGYCYATGGWRVPPGIRHARFRVVSSGRNSAVIESEVDLINGQGKGLPLLFIREISVTGQEDGLTVSTHEKIRYLGANALSASEFRLVPWSLCQFDCRSGCEVIFKADEGDVWDLYEAPDSGMLYWKDGQCHAITDGTARYQLGIGAAVSEIEYRDPDRGLRVIRKAEPPGYGCEYIDIRDASPEKAADGRGVRYSVYSDPSGFMEIEAAGGMPSVVLQGQTLSQRIDTRYILNLH